MRCPVQHSRRFSGFLCSIYVMSCSCASVNDTQTRHITQRALKTTFDFVSWFPPSTIIVFRCFEEEVVLINCFSGWVSTIVTWGALNSDDCVTGAGWWSYFNRGKTYLLKTESCGQKLIEKTRWRNTVYCTCFTISLLENIRRSSDRRSITVRKRRSITAMKRPDTSLWNDYFHATELILQSSLRVLRRRKWQILMPKSMRENKKLDRVWVWHTQCETFWRFAPKRSHKEGLFKFRETN